MNKYLSTVLIVIIVAVAAAVVVIELLYLFRAISDRLNASRTRDVAEYNRLMVNLMQTKVSYTDDVLKFIREFAADNSVLKYESYISNTNMEKLNRSNLANFASDAIREIKDSLHEESIDYDMLLVSAEYIDELIIDTCIYNIRTLFEKSVEESDDVDEINI